MYRVDTVTDGKTYPLYRPGAAELSLIEPVLDLELNKAGTFTFGITAAHPHRRHIRAITSEIHVYRNSELIFCGRVATPEEDFYRTGTILCEGELAYLRDSIVRPYEDTGGIDGFFTRILNNHNGQVEPGKRFLKGRVGVAGQNNEMERSNSRFSNSLEALREKLTAVHGGYLKVRHEKDGRYLDYVSDYGGTNSQVIRFGEGLLDLHRRMDATEVITCLIPTGARIKNAKAADGAAEGRADITSVNNGLDYIIDEKAAAAFGKIWANQEFPDAETPEVLLKKARIFLQEKGSLPQTLTLNAVDLSLVKTDIGQIRLGWWTKVESGPQGGGGEYMTSKLVLHLNEPEKDVITLGGTLPTLSESITRQQTELSEKVQSVADYTGTEINQKIENATNLITGGLGGYVVISLSDPDQHPEEILIMDTPQKETAKNVIRLNKNGLGFSNTGYNGIYRNAWTIDGNLTADFITGGTMLADRIRGGTLEVGGTGLGANGSIVVKTAGNQVAATLNQEGLKVRNGYIEGPEISGGKINGTNIETNSLKVGNGTFVVESRNDRNDELNRMLLFRETEEGRYEAGIQPGGIYEKTNDASVQLSGGAIFATDDINSGSAFKGQAAVISGNIDADGYVKSQGQVLTSDRAAKTDVRKADRDRLKSLLMRMEPYMFRYKEHEDSLHCGFIYQDVKPVLKELDLDDFALCNIFVSPQGEEQKVMSYTELIPACILLMQDLYQKIEEMESEREC